MQRKPRRLPTSLRGPRLAGRYSFTSELGRGATGRVLLVHDVYEGGEQRAAKVVGHSSAERLRWEFALLSKVAHPNLAHVYELLQVAEPLGHPFDLSVGNTVLIQQYAPGKRSDLAVRKVPDGPERVHFVCAVGEACARALNALHASGFVHGDVKPQNLVVGEPTYLVDLGAARVVGIYGELSGTPRYCAPEVFAGEVGPAADLYSLGATMIDLLSPRAAFSSDTSRTFTEWLAPSAYARDRLRELPSSIPEPLVSLLKSLLDSNPSKRPDSALDVAEQLRALSRKSSRRSIFVQPTPAERSISMTTLPWVGDAALIDRLAASMTEHDVVIVHGPNASGRSRAIREAIKRTQLRLGERERRVPTYILCSTLPAAPLTHDAIVQLETADGIAFEDARFFVQACSIEGAKVTVVLERIRQVDDYDGPQFAIEPLNRAGVRSLLSSALRAEPSEPIVDAALRVSGGLAGRLCRLLSDIYQAGDEPSADTILQIARTDVCTLDLPPAGLPLAKTLAAIGGSLRFDVLTKAMNEQQWSEGRSVLHHAGLVTENADGEIVLRTDVVRSLRNTFTDVPSGMESALYAAPLDDAGLGWLEMLAGRYREATTRFLAAAELHRRKGRPEDAAALLSECLQELRRRSNGGADGVNELIRSWADALRASARYDEALRALEGVNSPECMLLCAEVARLKGDLTTAERCLQAVSEHSGEAYARAANALRSRIEFDKGDLSASQKWAEKVGNGSDADASRALEVLALVRISDGDFSAAANRAMEAVTIAQLRKDVAAEARATSILASISLAEGEISRAALQFARAYDLACVAGERHAQATFQVNAGLSRFDAGEGGQALASLREGSAKLMRIGRERDVGRALYNVANAAHLLGDDDTSRRALSYASQVALKTQDVAAYCLSRSIGAESALRRNDLVEARACLESIEAHAGRLPAAELLPLRARTVGLWIALGDQARASSLLAMVEHDDEVAVAQVRAELQLARASVYLARRELDEASVCCVEAVIEAEKSLRMEVRLRALLMSARVADARGERGDKVRLLALARRLLDLASAGLSSAARARLRSVPEYLPAFSAAPAEGEPSALTDHSWRVLSLWSKKLARAKSRAGLFDELVTAALELVNAERAFVVDESYEVDHEQNDRTIAKPEGALGLAIRAPRSPNQRTSVQLSMSVVERVLRSGRPISTLDAIHDQRLASARSVHALALRSIVAVPILPELGERAVLYLDDSLRPAAFGEREIEQLQTLAEIAAVTEDNRMLLRREQASTRRLERMKRRLAKTVETQAVELASLRRISSDTGRTAGIVAQSEIMRSTLALVERVAPTDVPVLIVGESGTGKELIARALHDLSLRRGSPFIAENCGAIPETLLESTLFGHVRGAFTGADQKRAGLLEAADGGTLFLDEIGEMSPGMQMKLLRVLQDGELRPVGGERSKKVDVRFIAATHRDLDRMVEEGTFRKDLFFRLAVVVIRVPSLRERPEDVAPLAAHFIAKYAKGRSIKIDRRVLSTWTHNAWPGNVRQLENEIQRALVLTSDIIQPEHLHALQTTDRPPQDSWNLRQQLDSLERHMIRQALSRVQGNQSRAAELLGVSRFGLQKMIKRLGL